MAKMNKGQTMKVIGGSDEATEMGDWGRKGNCDLMLRNIATALAPRPPGRAIGAPPHTCRRRCGRQAARKRTQEARKRVSLPRRRLRKPRRSRVSSQDMHPWLNRVPGGSATRAFAGGAAAEGTLGHGCVSALAPSGDASPGVEAGVRRSFFSLRPRAREGAHGLPRRAVGHAPRHVPCAMTTTMHA